MTIDSEIYAENQFLSLLYFEFDKVYDLLQVKSEYFKEYPRQKIFNLIIESFQEIGTVDNAYIMDKLNGNDVDIFTEIIDVYNTPLTTEIRKHFMSAQNIIFSNYKKRLISRQNGKLARNEITADMYLKEMTKIDDLKIISSGNYLTKEELINGLYSGVRIHFKNFPKLDKILSFKETDLLVVGGATGMGKSGLLINFMNDLIENYHCIYFNLEVAKNTIYSRLLSIATGAVPMDSILNKNLTDNQKRLIREGIDKIIGANAIIETKSYTIGEIETYIRVMQGSSDRHTIVFIDHVGLVISDVKGSSYEQTTSNMRRLRQICMKYNVTIIVACQLKRDDTGKPITLSSLKESGEIENSACQVILMNYKEKNMKDSTEPEMVLDVAKNRANFTGQVEVISTRVNQVFKERNTYVN